MANPVQLTQLEFQTVALGLSRWAGLRFDDRQRPMLQQAVEHRIRLTAAPTLKDYLAQLTPRSSEWQALYEAVAVHETAFFRHSGQFNLLISQVLPELVRQRQTERRLRLWSAATATGEEAFSLAIAAAELGLDSTWKIDILGTDLSSSVLTRARQATYSSRRLRNLPNLLRDKYLEPLGNDLWQVKPAIRQMVRFGTFNLAYPPQSLGSVGQRDVVIFANTLIYFTPEASDAAIGFMRRVLPHGGYLFLGYAETLWGRDTGFQLVSFAGGSAYQFTTTPADPSPTTVPQTEKTTSRHPDPVSPRPHRRSATGPLNTAERRFMTRVEAQIETNNLDEAIRVIEEWLVTEPDAPRAMYTHARVLAAQDKISEAIELLRKVLTIDSLHASSYVLLGMLCYRMQEHDEALGQFRRALFIEPNAPLAYYYQGCIFEERNEIDRARLAFRNAIRAASHYKPAWDSNWTPELLLTVSQRHYERLQDLEGIGEDQ